LPFGTTAAAAAERPLIAEDEYLINMCVQKNVAFR